MNSELENLATDLLIELALTKKEAWDCIAVLHYRGTEDIKNYSYFIERIKKRSR